MSLTTTATEPGAILSQPEAWGTRTSTELEIRALPSRHSSVRGAQESSTGNHGFPRRPSSNEDAAPPAKAIKLKLLSFCLCFIVAGLNDGSIGALTPYFIDQYHISTGFVSLIYATSFSGWAVAALVMPVVKLYAGLKGTLLLGASLYILGMALRIWVGQLPAFRTKSDACRYRPTHCLR